jgi:hypothetical protein
MSRNLSDTSYKEDLKFDKYSLDEEWERQPSLYMKWGEREADAQEEKDKAERALSIIKSEMDAKIRSNPEKYRIEKISESAINYAVLNSKEYREAELIFIEAKKKARLLNHAVVAFDHKKRALTKESDLWINGYYGGQGLPRNSREQMDIKRKERQLEGLNRRKIDKR